MFDIAALAECQEDLVSALASGAGSGLDEAGMVDALRTLEDLGRTITASQAQLALELDAAQTRPALPDGLDLGAVERRARESRRSQSVAAQVAFARRESPHRGRRHLSLARIASAELPHTWRAWCEGRTSEWRVSLVARETSCLSREDRLAVDTWIAADPDRFETMGDRALAGAVATEAARLDAASVVLRRRRAEGDRHVSVRPAPDTMTWFSALLPVQDSVAVLAALGRAADSARATGDPRMRGQVMADTLVDRVLGRTRGADAGPVTGPDPAAFELGLVMSDRALFTGADDGLSHLDGYGPIPDELAREIIAAAIDEETEVAIRRLYAEPTTGELVAMDSESRCFRGNLARFIRLRDRVCRTPWCDAPIRHVDHVLDHDDGGPTSANNGQGLCEACNHAKQEPGWRARPGPEGEVVTTMPGGHTFATRPPVVATVRTTPIRIDYVLAG